MTSSTKLSAIVLASAGVLGILSILAFAHEPSAAESQGVVDPAFTLAPLWNDGKAEISLYRLETEWALPSGPLRQVLRPLILLVKHPIDPQSLKKWSPGDTGEPVSALEWQVLYDVNNTRRSRLVTARQRDLRPLRQNYGSLSWEGNCNLDWRLPLGKPAAFQSLCSGSPPKEAPIELPANGFTALQVPLVVRSVSLSGATPRTIQVLDGEGTPVRTELRMLGRETIDVGDRALEAEKIEVRYARVLGFPGAVLSTVAPIELYWRGLEPHRPLLRLEGNSPGFVKYRMELIESFRSAWWEEDVRERLRKLGEVPGIRMKPRMLCEPAPSHDRARFPGS